MTTTEEKSLRGRFKDDDDVAGFIVAWDALVTSPDGYQVVMLALAEMTPEGRRRWLRGKRAALAQARAGWLTGFPASRSAAYDYEAINRVAVPLHERGLVNIDAGYRDVANGRRVRVLLRELARLDYRDAADLAETYEVVRQLPLEEVRRVVRTVRSSDKREVT